MRPGECVERASGQVRRGARVFLPGVLASGGGRGLPKASAWDPPDLLPSELRGEHAYGVVSIVRRFCPTLVPVLPRHLFSDYLKGPRFVHDFMGAGRLFCRVIRRRAKEGNPLGVHPMLKIGHDCGQGVLFSNGLRNRYSQEGKTVNVCRLR